VVVDVMNKYLKIGIVVLIVSIILIIRFSTRKTIDDKKGDLKEVCEKQFGESNVIIACKKTKCMCLPINCADMNMTSSMSDCMKYLETARKEGFI
jgi:hypothetical protein